MDVAELIARESIRDLVVQYAHAADRGRFDEVGDLFAADGILELPDGRTAQGPDGIRAFLSSTGDELRTVSVVPWVRHHVASHRIVVHGESDAEGFAYFFVITERGPDHWGRYHDRYALTDGVWLFARRRVRVDGRAAGSWAGSRNP